MSYRILLVVINKTISVYTSGKRWHRSTHHIQGTNFFHRTRHLTDLAISYSLIKEQPFRRSFHCTDLRISYSKSRKGEAVLNLSYRRGRPHCGPRRPPRAGSDLDEGLLQDCVNRHCRCLQGLFRALNPHRPRLDSERFARFLT